MWQLTSALCCGSSVLDGDDWYKLQYEQHLALQFLTKECGN